MERHGRGVAADVGEALLGPVSRRVGIDQIFVSIRIYGGAIDVLGDLQLFVLKPEANPDMLRAEHGPVDRAEGVARRDDDGSGRAVWLQRSSCVGKLVVRLIDAAIVLQGKGPGCDPPVARA